ncbi:MAG: UDP-N-acetylmuramoyl-L-alanyl-D-glutamate--2,6-diaminopimelate ligase [Betaproteobacteria bacterium]|nr:UDP-N-acetylmuramoyl-L-alanyl-D-glutamate--2,6-diaminopimelate ligase [Betaproteobacteria bacterium]
MITTAREDVVTPAGNGSLPADFTPVQLANALAAMPVRLSEVTASSKDARQGHVFLAYPGTARDGRSFIPDAVARGVSAVLFDPKDFAWQPQWRVPHLGVPDLKAHASQIAGHVYGHPDEALWMVGVTGTNGKTSVSQWVAQGLSLAGRAAGVIGTIGQGRVGALLPTDNTTPDAVALQRALRDFVRDGLAACAMEVSSHGLDQGRVADVKFDVAVFTNLTRDHLDYHGTMEAYGEAKAKLFAQRGVKHAIVNVDDAFGLALAERLKARNGMAITRFSARQNGQFANLAARNIALSPAGMEFDVAGEFGQAHVETGILGAFNVSNLLAVIGALLASGIELKAAAALAERLSPVPGRMQTLREHGKPLVVVDYAHTPDALEKALSTLAAIVPEHGRLISVFGCGGDRDRGKRPQMGAISGKFADFTVLTSDNPRTEDAGRILADIEQGMGGSPYKSIPGRHEAIFAALNEARAEDVVLIAGKGHEDYQIIGEEKQHFSDVEVAREALAGWQGGVL